VQQATSTSAGLDEVLAALLRRAPELHAAAVVSYDGLPMASAMPPGFDEDRVAAMSAALLSLGERASEGLGRGSLAQVYVEGENGAVHLVGADDEAVLVAVASPQAKTGLVLFELRRSARDVAAVLRGGDGADPLDEALSAALAGARLPSDAPAPTPLVPAQVGPDTAPTGAPAALRGVATAPVAPAAPAAPAAPVAPAAPAAPAAWGPPATRPTTAPLPDPLSDPLPSSAAWGWVTDAQR
jgi:predicted regulator of Ras-like GTPase activity (Roadblock/LC7/MglB family)